MSPYNIQDGQFLHHTLSGTSYQAGRQQGEWLSHNQGFLRFFTSAEVNLSRFGYASFSQVQEAYEQVCPGINAEIQGMADALNVPVEKILFYDQSYLTGGNCSHMAVLQSATRDAHVLVGRSYEWKPDEDDLRLCTTQITGKARHIGFSCMVFGRMDGINEHGLSITMSGGMAAGLPYQWTTDRGVQFWVAIRALLDQCQDVQQALEMLASLPIGSYCNLLLADRGGTAALVEIAGRQRAVKQVDQRDSAPYLVTTNHFTLGEMPLLHKNQFILDGSIPRYNAITQAIHSDLPHVTRDTLRGILATEIPNGCFGPYYAQGFGTLWSQIYDLTSGEVEICFGAPGYNPWRTFTLDTPAQEAPYPVRFPQKV